MKIKHLSVKGLFGIFDHEIPLNMDERITIIHGPNGYGKTAVLRLLNNFFRSQYTELKKTPFDSFKIEFDNCEWIEIIQRTESSKKKALVFNFYGSDRVMRIFSFENSKEKILNSSAVSNTEEIRRQLQLLAEQLSAESTDATEKSGISSEYDFISKSRIEPDWLLNLKNSIHVRLIESQRLLNFDSSKQSRGSYKESPMRSTVASYSIELAELMQNKFSEYGTISQSLDRTFPLRIMQKEVSVNVTEEKLRTQLDEIEKTRSQLIEVGLLDKDESSEPTIQPQNMDESTRNTLSVYVEDVEKKLSVFTDTAKKIQLLRRIINKKFSYSRKEMNFSKEKGFVFGTHYNSQTQALKTLSPNDLSSGEQHELVLLYELLFKVESNSLVLIDEPELSLHVTWQAQFLEDIQEIMELTDLSVLMATHSPDIIQDRWDLAVSLSEEAE